LEITDNNGYNIGFVVMLADARSDGPFGTGGNKSSSFVVNFNFVFLIERQFRTGET
jgi:hypothetical protein